MKITTDGLVIWEVKTGEADRVLTLLTPGGVRTAYAKNSLRPRNKLTSPTAMLSYANFELFTGKNMYTVDDASSLRRFVRLSGDVCGYALAAYFCELLKLLAPVEDDAGDFLSLALNSLYLLDAGEKPRALVKAVFELRAMAFAGYMPDLVQCAGCGAYDSERVYFDLEDGTFLCADCAQKLSRACNCRRGVLFALRHILYSDKQRAWSFSLGARALDELSQLAEAYVVAHIEKQPATLDFYNTIK